MSVSAKDHLHHPVARPSENLAEFVVILRRGFNFSAGNTSAWSFEDWEAAVDAIDDDDDTGVAPKIGRDIFDPTEIGEGEDTRFEGHGLWTLLALAYMRGRKAFRSGISKTARPFRSMQLKHMNVPTGVGDSLDMQFRNGFDDALADAVMNSDRTPDWVRHALKAPLMRSKRERE